MKLGQKVKYDGHKLGLTSPILGRKDIGEVTAIPSNGWVEVTLESGPRIAMEEARMRVACGIEEEERHE